MSKLMHDFGIAVMAAVADTAKNIFRPVHNAKVIFGIEHEKSVSEMIKETDEKTKQSNIATPTTR